MDNKKMLPSSSSLVKYTGSSSIAKTIGKLSSSPIDKKEVQKNNIGSELLSIKKTLVKIEKTLKEGLLLQKKGDEILRKKEEKQKFEKREKKLEEVKNEDKERIDSGIEIPRPNFLDKINRFITFTLLGWAFNNLMKYIPKLLGVVRLLAPVGEFLSSFATNLFTGFVNFIDFGYDAYDKVKDFAKNLGGEDFQKTFDEFSGNLNKFVNLAIIAGIAASGGTDFGLGKKGGKPGTPSRPGQGGRPRVTTSGGGAPGRLDIRNPLRSGPKVTTSGGGAAGAPNIRNPLRSGPKVTTSGGGASAGRFAGIGGRIPIIGGLVSFIINVLSGEPVGRAAAKAVGFSIGSALGTFVPVPFVGTILGGMLGDIVGGALYDTLVGNKTEKPKVVAKSKGGKVTTRKGEVEARSKGGQITTRGGKKVGGEIKRTLKVGERIKKSSKPKKIVPGFSVGGIEKVKKIFPEPSKEKFNTSMNPYELVYKTAESFNDIPYIGSLLGLFGKVLLGDKPDISDYKNIGIGMNEWITNAIGQGQLQGNLVSAFSDGGIIENEFKRNISGWVEKSVEELVKNKVTEAINELKRNLGLEPISGTGDQVSPGDTGDDRSGSGGAVESIDIGGFSAEDVDALGRMIAAESAGESSIGKAGVLAVILNRYRLIKSGAATPRSFNVMGKSKEEVTIRDILFAGGKGPGNQFSPYKDGNFDRTSSSSGKSALASAIQSGGNDPKKFKDNLIASGLSEIDADYVVTSVSFSNARTRSSRPFSTREVTVGNHVFQHSPFVKLSSPGERIEANISTSSSLMGPSGTVFGGSLPSSKVGSKAGDRWGRTHKGNDYPMPPGTPITMLIGGTVTRSGIYGDYGNLVEIKHQDNSKTAYAHLQRINVRNGQTISPGTVIGTVGYTGRTLPSGPAGSHLHFEYDGPDGKPVINWRIINQVADKTFRFGGNVTISPSDVHKLAMKDGREGIIENGQWKPKRWTDEERQRYNRTKGSGNVMGASNLSSLRGKDKKIYLHWNAGSPSSAPTNYHTSILGSGEIRRVTPYDDDRVPHTYRRNSNAIGISVSGMEGASPNNFGAYSIKPLQYQKMAEEVAQVAKSMGWTSGNINIKNVMTHAEAGSNKDGTRPHENYGPVAWGGDGDKWDLFKLYQGDRDGTGGDKIRGMIKQKMQGGGVVGDIQSYADYEDHGGGIEYAIQPIIYEKIVYV